MDDDPGSPGTGTFLTPESQSRPPAPVQTPGTAGTAHTQWGLSASAKKRPASTPQDDDSSPTHNTKGEEGPGFFGRVMHSLTPWKTKSTGTKRPRASLEGMSGSAIKSANRTPGGSDGYKSDGVNSSGRRLQKLNLERKFDSSPAAATAANGDVPVQHSLKSPGMLHRPPADSAMELPASKRVRLATGAAPANPQPPAARTVNFGSTTTFAPTPPTAALGALAASTAALAATPGGAKLNLGGATPKFNVGSASKTPRLRDVRNRMGTPGGKMLAHGRHSALRGALAATAGSTPGTSGAPTVGGLTQTPGGSIAAGRNLSATSLSSVVTAKHSNAGTGRRTGTIPSRSTGYRRRPIRARGYKPMNRLLTGVYTERDGAADGEEKRKQSVMLTESIASQILEEHRNKLGLADGTSAELTLFGDKAKGGEARTFGEEAAAHRAVTKAHNVPRVRMNRILGSGQTGGRFHVPAAPSTSAAAAPAPVVGFAAAPAAAPPAATVPKKAVTFQTPAKATADTPMEDAETAAAPKPFVPYASATLTPRSTDPDLKLTPCQPISEGVSQESGEEFERLRKTPEWQAMGEEGMYGFEDADVSTPGKASATKAKAHKGTPHPKKAAAAMAAGMAAGIATPALMKRADDVAARAHAGATPGAPFAFMPGGAAASAATTTTPLGYKYGESPPKLAAEEASAPPAPAAAPVAASPAPAPAASGWGDLFKKKPGEWKCGVCSVSNPKEAAACLSCETPKPGGGGAGSSAPPAADGATKASGSIGAGGFRFGGTPASSAPAPAPAWNDVFALKAGEWKCAKCTAKNAEEDGQCAECQAPKDRGEKAAPAAFKESAAKAGIGVGGFSFGGTPAASSGPPASSGGGGGAGAVGFAFGGTSSATPTLPTTTPAKAKRGRDDDAAKDDASSGPAKASVPAFAFGAAPAAPAPTSTTKPSVGFQFGAASASSDEKKEDPAPAGGGFSFASPKPAPASEKKGASVPGFAFGAPPASSNKAPAAEEKKDDASEPPSKKAFSFGSGAPSLPVPAGKAAAPAAPGTPGFAFGAGSETKKGEAAAPSGAPSGAPGFAFGSAPAPKKPAEGASTPAPATTFQFGAKKDDAAASSTPALGGFGAGATPAKPADGSAAPAPFAFGAGGASQTPATTEKKTEAASSSKPAFGFGTTAASPTPAGAASAAPFASFGASSAPVPAGGGTTFAFGAGGASSATPAPAKPPAPAGASFAFGTTPAGGTTPAPAAGGFGSTPAPATGGFGATPAPTPAGGGFSFGSTGQTPAAAAPASTFGFGAGSANTQAPPSAGGFGATPALAAGGFGGFGSAAATPAAASATSTFAFGGTPAPPNPTTGFAAATPAPAFGAGAGFGATPSAMGATPGGGGFSIGTGGPKKTPGTSGKVGGRRILKARRPPGTGGR